MMTVFLPMLVRSVSSCGHGERGKSETEIRKPRAWTIHWKPDGS